MRVMFELVPWEKLFTSVYFVAVKLLCVNVKNPWCKVGLVGKLTDWHQRNLKPFSLANVKKLNKSLISCSNLAKLLILPTSLASSRVDGRVGIWFSALWWAWRSSIDDGLLILFWFVLIVLFSFFFSFFFSLLGLFGVWSFWATRDPKDKNKCCVVFFFFCVRFFNRSSRSPCRFLFVFVLYFCACPS